MKTVAGLVLFLSVGMAEGKKLIAVNLGLHIEQSGKFDRYRSGLALLSII